jgi:glycosyltransferase involved in cell wall biosynthesis
MWRKSLHDEFGGFDETLTCAADWDFWLKAAQKYNFKHIPETLGLYYRNENGIEHGRKIHSLYERYAVGRRYGNPYISVIQKYEARGNPLVSVVMTAYNAADYIAGAIESVLIQNYRNFELIVVDDGSTDNTADIVRRFENEPIKYFFKTNGGVASARNFGLQKAGGPFIVMLDSDDMMTPDYIARHLEGFERHPEADMVYCDDLLIDEHDKPIRVISRPQYANNAAFISDIFRCGFPVVHFKTCIRRSVFDKIGLYDEELIVGEDYEMIRRFAKQKLNMVHLPEPLYLRRIVTSSLSRTFNAAKAKSHFTVVDRISKTFSPEELFPDVQWDALPAEEKSILEKCRKALVYIGIGEQYIKSNAPDYSAAAFDLACEQLEDCCKIEPANQQVRNLREKCLAIRAKHSSSGSRGVYQTV